jgi:hypothetical protein
MKKPTSSEIKRGQAITFRVPSDTSDYTLAKLQKLKETEKRNFSSKIAEFVLDGVGNDSQRSAELITLPIPQRLSKAQRDWLKHAHSEALLGNILYELLMDPMRVTALFASLSEQPRQVPAPIVFENEPETALPEIAIELEQFESSESLEEQNEQPPIEQEEQLDELLGDFLSQMNK